MTALWSLDIVDASAMRRLGGRLAANLRAGDVVLLVGPLGAGKTTMARGIAEELEVEGLVTSPTFVIAREHPSRRGGPTLVHVDAYRLGGLDELDDLDLESSMNESVTVVEWGDGLAEHLRAPVITVTIARGGLDGEPMDATLDGGETTGADGPRHVTVQWPVGRP